MTHQKAAGSPLTHTRINGRSGPSNGSNGRHGASRAPKRQLDRSAWFTKFDRSIGQLVRLVDQIAREVGEKHGQDHRAVQDLLEQAAEAMAQWMQER